MEETSNDAKESKVVEDEIDPLDAYMVEISGEVEKLKTDSLVKAKNESSMDKHMQVVEEEEEKEEEEKDQFQLPEILSSKKVIELVDHSKIDYQPFRKEFYIEVPEISKMTPEDVKRLRKKYDNIKIRGKGCPRPIKNFAQSGLPPSLLDRMKKLKFEKPTPIQAQAIPSIMMGRDIIGIAKTGSGKTLAFLLPMIRHILDQPPVKPGEGPIALIMAPTRELVMQINSDLKLFSGRTGIRSIAIFGGAVVAGQISELKRGAEVIVCTPGRMIDVLCKNKGRVTNLHRVTFLVIDEADRMFDLGFEQQILKIVNIIRPDRQTVMFSATFPRQVELAARKILNQPLEITVHGRSVVSDTVNQIIEIVDTEQKFRRLVDIISQWYEKGSILVFVDKQDSADDLFMKILKTGYLCVSLHSGKEQIDRKEAMDNFKSGDVKILIATSLASRGLDVPNLPLVINYDVPDHYEDYVHRVGRTGRAGASGTAITFISPNEEKYAGDLVKALKHSQREVPPELQKLADSYVEKLDQGLTGSKKSGFEGRGYMFNEEEEQKRKEAINFEKKRLLGTEFEDVIAIEEEEVFDENGEPILKETPMVIVPEVTSKQPSSNLTIDQRMAQEKMKLLLDTKTKLTAKMDEISTNNLGYYEASLEINDFPQQARWKVTHKDALSLITESTGCAITTKGVHVAPGKQPPQGERKLYLHIEGSSQEMVNLAKQDIIKVLSEAMANLPPERITGRYSVV